MSERKYPRYDRDLNCMVLRPETVQERRSDRFWTTAAVGFTVLLLILALLPIARALAQPITGRASVIDGDTIEIRGTHIRLWGIDAPESGQTCHARGRPYRCGTAAARALDALLASARPTVCATKDIDRYGRTVAICTAGGRDVADALVRAGLAVDYPTFSKGAYTAAEDAARASRSGLWAGSFMKPWDWRHR